MSYPPPPGLPSKNSSSSSSTPHPSLPPRPPPSNTNYKPSFPQNARGGSSSAFSGFAPRSVAPPQASYNNYQQPSYQPQQPQSYNSQYSTTQQEPAYGAAPQIRNPFAAPGAAGPSAVYEEDPEMLAQIAQWQSAYTNPPPSNGGYTGIVRKYPVGESSGAATSANAAPLGGRGDNNMSSAAMTSAAHNDTGVATVVSDSKTNTKTVVRTGGGTTWTDASLLEWDPSHFRIFVGNLAGEVTDESLLKAFSRWPSAHKAKVIRDKRTTKSKGFGFVSFTDGDDYFQAARDMQGKYIGSHPVLIRRSTTEIKAVNPKDGRGKNGGGKYGKNKNKNKKGGKDDLDKTGAGVQKAGSKTKGGLKVLG